MRPTVRLLFSPSYFSPFLPWAFYLPRTKLVPRRRYPHGLLPPLISENLVQLLDTHFGG